MKYQIYCNRCSKELSSSEDIFWIRLSKKYPNKAVENDDEACCIHPLCKDCYDKTFEFIRPINLDDDLFKK